MALPHDYRGQGCSLARTLEVIGERWTLLIIRDAFYGARRFGEFVEHLNVPRAVLTERLNSLVAAGVMEHNGLAGRGSQYTLTAKGIELWPVVRALMTWGDEHYAPAGPRRVFTHDADDGELDAHGVCAVCGDAVDAARHRGCPRARTQCYGGRCPGPVDAGATRTAADAATLRHHAIEPADVRRPGEGARPRSIPWFRRHIALSEAASVPLTRCWSHCARDV